MLGKAFYCDVKRTIILCEKDFALRTLLYGDDTFDFTENKSIINETLRFINDSKRFVRLRSICYVSFLTVCVHHSL